MSKELHSRLVEAGWSITVERRIELDVRGETKSGESYTVVRATKEGDEVVVKTALGHEQDAIREIYKEAKVIDPVLQQVAMEAGSGAWVIDLSQAEWKSETQQ